MVSSFGFNDINNPDVPMSLSALCLQLDNNFPIPDETEVHVPYKKVANIDSEILMWTDPTLTAGKVTSGGFFTVDDPTNIELQFAMELGKHSRDTTTPDILEEFIIYRAYNDGNVPIWEPYFDFWVFQGGLYKYKKRLALFCQPEYLYAPFVTLAASPSTEDIILGRNSISGTTGTIYKEEAPLDPTIITFEGDINTFASSPQPSVTYDFSILLASIGNKATKVTVALKDNDDNTIALDSADTAIVIQEFTGVDTALGNTINGSFTNVRVLKNGVDTINFDLEVTVE